MPAPRRRMPDEVRSASVRTVIFLALTIIFLMYSSMASLDHAKKAMTAGLILTGVGVFGIAWCLLEIVISRQIAAQRRRGPGRDGPLAGSRPPRP
ncbi:hypothetical protein ACFYNO_35220 [Kitasatospora sp. NPDC006697]|uniref:hypothetical protein n=1 Tax=Kitasatospora sp. NPDC006697 TaxID=3364020 RepID=UPI0036839F63